MKIIFAILPCLFLLTAATFAAEPIAGGWSVYSPVDKKDRGVFESAMKDIVGVSYTPLAVSTQVVSGRNYRFFCATVATTNPPKEGNALVEFYVDLENKPGKTTITDVSLVNGTGAYTVFKALDDDAKKVFDTVFDTAFAKLVGQKYEALGVATQVVAGTNYRFLCLTRTETDPPRERNVLAVVYADLQGGTTVTETKEFKPGNLLDILSPKKRDSENNRPQQEKSPPGWKLVWEENFDKDGKIDETVWSKIPRGGSDWNRHMSDHDALYDVKDGNLILRGMVNPGLPGDTAPFITGGVFTKDKKGFEHGRIEIKAKLGNAKGAWPAFWLLPFDNERWPRGGEIDIMERLNSDVIAYQTVHSHYTVNLKQTEPKKGATGAIHKDKYNVYAVELYPDQLVFSINGKETFVYPRIETDLEGQFPFDRPFYLLLDMQLGGKWVGEVNPNDLPVEMSIDWVRFYKKEEAASR